MPDWELITFVVTGDFTLVTHNARDFRGEGQENSGGLHAQQEIHAGLICLNSFYPMDLDRQHRLFQLALAELDGMPDLINQALEIFEDEEGTVTAELYDIPTFRARSDRSATHSADVARFHPLGLSGRVACHQTRLVRDVLGDSAKPFQARCVEGDRLLSKVLDAPPKRFASEVRKALPTDHQRVRAAPGL